MPYWLPILEAAEKWGTPPWVLEEEAPQVWIERWRAWRDERAAYRPGGNSDTTAASD